MQPPLTLQKFDSHLSGDRLIATQKELAENEMKKLPTNATSKNFDNQSFKMVKASSFMSFNSK